MLKRVALAGIAIALILSLGVAGIWLWGQAASPVAAQSIESADGLSPAETITVVGQGSISVSPDIARVSLGVETSAETIGEAVAENETLMTSILAALEEAGVDDKDVQTMNYSIRLDRYPEQFGRVESSIEEPQPLYRVSNMVSVTIRDLDNVGNVLDAVIAAGANDIWGINFAVDDPSKAQDEARAGAIEDALARAGALAELNGVELGPVMSVTEIIGATPVPKAVALESAAGGGPISPGELEIGYQVQVTYFIER